MVGQFVRVLLTVALQSMSTIMNQKHVWAFSLAVDANSHMVVFLLDQHIRICVEGVLYNLHMVLVPFFERHLAVNYVKLIKTMLDTLCPDWRSKLISISSDGENTMTGQHGRVVTLLENECNNPVLRIWCVPHQLDIVVKNTLQDVLDQAFYKVAHAYSVHLRVQQNLITDMGSKCPKDTMRWVAFGSILHWLLQNYRRLMIHNVAKRPVQAPSEMWWVIAAAISPLFNRIVIMFTKIQARNIMILQQRQEMSKLVADIVAGLDIRPATNEALEGVDPLTIITRSNWFILKYFVIMHIQDQGSWVRDLYNALSDTDKQTTLKEITIFGIFIVANVSHVQAERDSNNNARELEAPPVMLADLVKIHPTTFI